VSSEPLAGAGHKCRVCSMPFASELMSCPSCAYDRRAAAEAGATPPPDLARPGERARSGRASKDVRWWRAKR